MIDTRFVLPVALLFLLAGVPTFIHSYRGSLEQDGYRTTSIPAHLAQGTSTGVNRPHGWIEETYGTFDWLERDYRFPEGGSARLFVARSYDAKKLYHHPELGVLHGKGLEWTARERFNTRPDMPVTVLRGEHGSPGVAFYSLLADSEFMDNPYTFQLRMSFKMLAGGRKPVTLFLAFDPAFPPGARVESSRALGLLNAAVEAFLMQTAKP